MSVLETMRTMALLRNQGMPVAAVAVNMIQPDEPDCHFCTSRRQAHVAQLERIRALAPDVPVLTVEHAADEPRGEQALLDLSESVWVEGGSVLRDRA